MNLRKGLIWLILSGFVFTPALAEAGHLGGYLGPSFISGGGTRSSTDFTGGLDLAFSLVPAVEGGAFYTHTAVSNAAIVMLGAELNLYPLVTHDFFLGVKAGNANQSGDNRIVYAPAAGLSYDLASSISIGLDVDYFFFNNSSEADVAVLASLKIWF